MTLTGTSATAEPAGQAQRLRPDVFPTLTRNLVAFYDFEHPVPGNPAVERDQGRSGTDRNLINGGAAMRVRDGAYRSSRMSMQARQISPTTPSNDDWKAGVHSPTGVPSPTRRVPGAMS